MFAFVIGALSVIGVPPMGGSWSKWYLALGAVHSGQLVFVGVLMVSSLMNIAYLMPIPIRAFFSKPSAAPHGHDDAGNHDGMHEAPLLMVGPLLFTALGCIVLFFLAGPVYRLLEPIVR
jgi:multicomponent Na+:H+ antiporter subunit D